MTVTLDAVNTKLQGIMRRRGKPGTTFVTQLNYLNLLRAKVAQLSSCARVSLCVGRCLVARPGSVAQHPALDHHCAL
jgi:hypothetical protein